MSSFRGILFDMDGVVLDSEALHDRSKDLLFAEYDLHVPDEIWATFKGRSGFEIYELVARDYAGGKATAEELRLGKIRHMASLHGELRLVDGVLDTLSAVREAGIAAALVTSSARVSQESAFERFGLGDYFDAIVTADDVTRYKPDPMPYATGARLLGLDASDCVAIEDAVTGIQSANGAGARTIGLVGTFDADALREAGADAVAHSHADVRALLGLGA